MTIILNGQKYDFTGSNLAELIAERKLIPQRVFASVNAKVVIVDEYAQTVLQPGDEVELFSFVGGG